MAFALVARDRQLTCNRVDPQDIFAVGIDRSPLYPCRRKRRSRIKAAADAKVIAVTQNLPAFRAGGNSSLSKANRMSPCEYGQMMDHGFFGLHSGGHSDPNFDIKTVGRTAEAEGGELGPEQTLYERALSSRRMHLRRQALCLLDQIIPWTSGKGSVQDLAARSTRKNRNPHSEGGGLSSSPIKGSPQEIHRLESHSRGQAEHLGIHLMPHNPYRDKMARRVRVEESRPSHATSSSGILVGRKCFSIRENLGSLTGARAVVKKNCQARYEARWHEIAMLHRVLETGSNRRPAREILDIVDRAMREISSETALPGSLSRAQFVTALSGTLDPCDVSALHRIFSTFDADGTGNMQSVEFSACLLVTHKPEAEALLEELQHTFLRNLGAISSELHHELTKGNRQVCWRFLRRLFNLFQGDQAGLTPDDVVRIFQLCAASDAESQEMSTLVASRLHSSQYPSGKALITRDAFDHIFWCAFEILDLFNTQMTAVQVIAKRATPSN